MKNNEIMLTSFSCSEFLKPICVYACMSVCVCNECMCGCMCICLCMLLLEDGVGGILMENKETHPTSRAS